MAEGPSEDAPLVLLDGMSLAFRAFFALPTDIQTSAGVVTNALHGFASMVVSLVTVRRPRALAVAFDLPGGTFRDAMVEDYKGGRAETPPELEPQFDFIRSLCEVLRVPVLAVATYEADDVLATLASRSRDEGRPVIVVSGDRDTFQLVEDPFVRVLYNKRGVSEYDLYDEAGIFARCGVESARYPILAALRGDASDNLPGVPGVGEKTAAKLLASYRDLDELYRHLGDLTPKLRENLAAYEERARNNERVMRLVRDVPLAVGPDDLVLGGWREAEVDAFFDRFELNSVRRRVKELMAQGLLGSPDGAGGAAPAREEAPALALSIADLARGVIDDAAPVVAYHGGRAALVNPTTRRAAVVDYDQLFKDLAGRSLAGHDVKALYREAAARDVDLAEPAEDSSIMAYLLDSVSGRYDLAAVAQRYLHETVAEEQGSLLGGPDDEALIQAASTAARLVAVLAPEIESWELTRVYREIELPLVSVLARMEARGVLVDKGLLAAIAQEFSDEAAALDAEIQAAAGHPFKVNSSIQLQEVLFNELQLTAVKKIKTGYSTDAASLEAVADEHPIVALILRYREVEKLRSTYGASLIETVGPDSRIHATFSQTVARTGRLSSENPNLHNIPVRTTDGRRLRYAFVAPEGWLLCVSDYNQIELRVLAHLSQDAGLLGAFSGHEDVHRTIAAAVFNVAAAEVTAAQREAAKAVSYGLAYGMEAYGLSSRLGVSVADARHVMDQYFGGFPTLRAYMDRVVSEIRQRGYSRTEFGRIRPFPDLATAVGPQRQAAERQAMNAGIQGLAADIFKSGLVRLDRRLREAGLAARLVLQVHDEVLVEAPADERGAVSAVVVDSLTHAAELSVPLEVSLAWGRNWAEAKG